MNTRTTNVATCEGSLALSSRRTNLRVIEGGLTHKKPEGQVIAFSPSHMVHSVWPHTLLTGALAIVFILVITFGCVFTDMRKQSKLEGAFAAAPIETIVVHQGDSLWSIAEEHPVQGCTTSQVEHYIREHNELDSACLMAGMRIEVPSLG
ncbi:MAG: LysM peptidoglycan-binding domain-containing protein [Atopobiaceae bacterium]|nr:LysM peptidoglycan-binding domain-containing protein [Atopobiaceae bacterium]